MSKQGPGRPDGFRVWTGSKLFEEGGSGFHVAFEVIAARQRSVTRRVQGMHHVYDRSGRDKPLK
jgi:hypothetical protein